MADYVAHVYCDRGRCEFVFNEKPFALCTGDCAIFTITKLVFVVKPSDDFEATVIHLPDQGIHGNSHFLFQEMNNAEIADLIFSWLKEHGL